MVPELERERDLRWIDAINRGDAVAFEALYHHYRGWVLRLATRLSGDANEAEDVLQEAFSYLLRKVPDLYLEGRLTSLLYPVVKHLAAASRRRRARSPAVAAEEPAGRPETRTDRDELRHVLAVLPEGQREVLLMRTVDDMSLAEIALALELPVGTVKSRLHHAIATLRADERTRSYFER